MASCSQERINTYDCLVNSIYNNTRLCQKIKTIGRSIINNRININFVTAWIKFRNMLTCELHLEGLVCAEQEVEKALNILKLTPIEFIISAVYFEHLKRFGMFVYTG